MIQLNSVSVPLAEMQENYPDMFSAFQPYLPAQKPVKRRRLRKKRQTVAHLIDMLIDTIDSLE